MDRITNSIPFPVRKLRQILCLVRESNANPLTGSAQKPVLASPDQLGITFIGHSSFLIQVAGKNVLIDPVFAKRLILLRRQRRAGVRVADLPPIDAILLTHAHMDHLNLPSLRRIIRQTRRLTGHAPVVVVPRGVDDLVNSLGFREVITLKWWQTTELPADVKSDQHSPKLEITMTPCKHWGARMFKDTHRGFGGYVIAAAGHSLYHSGDTAYFNGFREIGRRLHPDVALLPIGAYYPDSYRAVHTSPEEAFKAFLDLGSARQMIPMHYGTFRLGREPMDEPLVRLIAAADRAASGDRLRLLSEGETEIQPAPQPAHASQS
jgi:L-ascorbate metabolism protein UlaG (beta-lactamase superfamily)